MSGRSSVVGVRGVSFAAVAEVSACGSFVLLARIR
jgi:hypothetical protein